jgi:hypothetical protein
MKLRLKMQKSIKVLTVIEVLLISLEPFNIDKRWHFKFVLKVTLIEFLFNSESIVYNLGNLIVHLSHKNLLLPVFRDFVLKKLQTLIDDTLVEFQFLLLTLNGFFLIENHLWEEVQEFILHKSE